MDQNEPTPTPWVTGHLVLTETVQKWSHAEREHTAALERRTVFKSYGNLQDRKKVCFCEREEDAKQIVKDVNYAAEVHKTIFQAAAATAEIMREREDLRALLREVVMREQLMFPENEKDLEWFDADLVTDDLIKRLYTALDLGNTDDYFDKKLRLRKK